MSVLFFFREETPYLCVRVYVYVSSAGMCVWYVISSGEMFCGGKRVEKRRTLKVIREEKNGGRGRGGEEEVCVCVWYVISSAEMYCGGEKNGESSKREKKKELEGRFDRGIEK